MKEEKEFYSPVARRRVKQFEEKILKGPSDPSIALDRPIVREFKEELTIETRTVENYNKLGEHYPAHKEDALRRALPYADGGLKIAAETKDPELAYLSLRLLGAINPKLAVGESEHAKWVDSELNKAYSGSKISPALASGYRDKIEDFKERLKKKSKLEEELHRFRSKGFVPRKAVSVASVCGIAVGALLLVTGITGNVIGMASSASNLFGSVLFLLGLAGLLFSRRK